MDVSDVVSPKFAPAKGKKEDLIDLNEIFADQYFPSDLDFSAYFNSDGASFDEGAYNEDMDYLLNLEETLSQPSNSYSKNPSESSNYIEPLTSGSSSEVIMIPPIIPARPTDIKMKKENTIQSREAIKGVVAMSKFTKKTKPSPIVSKFASQQYDDSDDDDLDERTGKRLKYDPNDPQRNERRERNREHAKKSRIRKKLLLDTLQDQLTGLRNVNIQLRRIITERLPPDLASKIFNECTTTESALLSEPLSSSSTLALSHDSNTTKNPFITMTKPVQSVKILMEPDFRLIQALLHSQQNFVLSDPSLPDNPIVYCSDGFCKLSGYKRQDVLGRNCRFLQGPGTDQNAVDLIRKGVAEGRDISVCLLNYKQDGTPFWNQFFVAALRDADGNVINFVGVQCEVNSLPVSEIRDRVKKLPLPHGYA